MKAPPVAVRIIALAAVAGLGAWFFLAGGLGRGHSRSNLLTLYGNVDVRQVELGFRVAGRLQTMALEEGQTVTAGMPMAALDPRPFQDQLRVAQAEVAAADANLKKLNAGNRPMEIARAKSAVDEAVASQQNARVVLDRAQQLIKQGAITQSTFDDAQAASRMADARLASANEQHRLLLQGFRSEDIAAGTANFELAQAHLASAQTALDDARLLAPSDGVVLSRVREPGAIVGPNDVVYVLSLTHSVWVRAYVSETELGKLRDGMKVAVISDAAPNHPFLGHLGFVSPTAEFTPKSVETPELRTELVYRLRIIVDDADTGLRQGMPVTVQIKTGANEP